MPDEFPRFRPGSHALRVSRGKPLGVLRGRGSLQHEHLFAQRRQLALDSRSVAERRVLEASFRPKMLQFQYRAVGPLSILPRGYHLIRKS